MPVVYVRSRQWHLSSFGPYDKREMPSIRLTIQGKSLFGRILWLFANWRLHSALCLLNIALSVSQIFRVQTRSAQVRLQRDARPSRYARHGVPFLTDASYRKLLLH